MTNVDKAFAEMLNTILASVDVSTRNSVTKRALNLSATFTSTPLISARRTAWKNAIREFEWFMSGSSNIKDLHHSVHHWWKPWANESGEIVNNYSKQFRKFENNKGSVDQIQYMIDALKNHPSSRRNIITTWNTADMISPETPITNCHGSLIGAFVDLPTNTVHLTMVQRSADMVLGVPHNWIQYWAFLLYLAHQCGRTPGAFSWTGWDCHVYQPHYEAADKIITTDFNQIKTPNLVYTPSGDQFKADDFSLDDEYKPLISEKLVMIV